MTHVDLTAEQLDRALGVLIGTAVGDALGAPLEFGPVIPYPRRLTMSGGGACNWKPGEWTDDTSMAIIIAKVLTQFPTITDEALDDIAQGFHDWAKRAPDVGLQTRAILSSAALVDEGAVALTTAAREWSDRNPGSCGNGALMRTSVLALAYLDDADGLADATKQVAALTHAHPDALDACVLWTAAVRSAVVDGSLDGFADALRYIDPDRQVMWAARIAEASQAEPWDFNHNGWVVHAFQAAFSAAFCTNHHDGASDNSHVVRAIDHAVRCGYDTDTVGAITGALVGAMNGLSAFPTEWVRQINGWPDMNADSLIALQQEILNGAAHATYA